MDCYGMKMNVPFLNSFRGGFMISGNYEKIKINEASCLKTDSNFSGMLSKLLVPEFYQKNLAKFDYLYDAVNMLNPQIASYLIRPSEILDTVTSQGISGLQKKVFDKRDHIIENAGINPMLLGDINSQFKEKLSSTDLLGKLSPNLQNTDEVKR
jgi:hypothetical protein